MGGGVGVWCGGGQIDKTDSLKLDLPRVFGALFINSCASLFGFFFVCLFVLLLF